MDGRLAASSPAPEEAQVLPSTPGSRRHHGAPGQSPWPGTLCWTGQPQREDGTASRALRGWALGPDPQATRSGICFPRWKPSGGDRWDCTPCPQLGHEPLAPQAPDGRCPGVKAVKRGSPGCPGNLSCGLQAESQHQANAAVQGPACDGQCR